MHSSSLMLMVTFIEGIARTRQFADKVQLHLEFLEDETEIQRCFVTMQVMKQCNVRTQT